MDKKKLTDAEQLLMDLMPGEELQVSPEDADAMGAVLEDALTEKEAMEGSYDSEVDYE